MTIAIGLLILGVGVGVDMSESRTYGFWLHVVAGLTIGGGLLRFFHNGTFDWIVVALIAIAGGLGRSSWIVLGAWGFLQTVEHFADRWSDIGESLSLLLPFFFFPFGLPFEEQSTAPGHQWIGALSFVAAGLFFMGLAQVFTRLGRRAVRDAGLL